MIIRKEKWGELKETPAFENIRYIAFPVCEEVNRRKFTAVSRIAYRIGWDELIDGNKNLRIGNIEIKEYDGVKYVAMSCYSEYFGWGRDEAITFHFKECLDKIPTNGVIVVDLVGTLFVNQEAIMKGLEESSKKIILM